MNVQEFFLENAFLWFVRAMKVAIIAENIRQPPSILSLFCLSYVYATATLSGENIHLHVPNVYVNKVVKEHPTKVILEDAVFFLLT